MSGRRLVALGAVVVEEHRGAHAATGPTPGVAAAVLLGSRVWNRTVITVRVAVSTAIARPVPGDDVPVGPVAALRVGEGGPFEHGLDVFAGEAPLRGAY